MQIVGSSRTARKDSAGYDSIDTFEDGNGSAGFGTSLKLVKDNTIKLTTE